MKKQRILSLAQLLFFSLLLSLSGLDALSQDTTVIYFDQDWEQCEKGEHEFYGKSFKLNDTLWGHLDFYKGGQLQMIGSYLTDSQSVKHGRFTYLEKNGDTSGIYDYERGEREGLFIPFYDNGTREVVTTLINGNQEGPTVYYHSNGELSSHGVFKDDVRVGEWKYYDKRGKYIASEHFIQSYEAPCGYSLTFPAKWIHVSVETYGQTKEGISLDRIYRRSVRSDKGKEQFFALDAICLDREFLSEDDVCKNMMKLDKARGKKIKSISGLSTNKGTLYRYSMRGDRGQKLQVLLYAEKVGDEIAQLKFSYEKDIDQEVIQEIVSIITSLEW
jgi:antitoxin component YwqK of YwqJK toxin-antitoxin module